MAISVIEQCRAYGAIHFDEASLNPTEMLRIPMGLRTCRPWVICPKKWMPFM